LATILLLLALPLWADEASRLLSAAARCEKQGRWADAGVLYERALADPNASLAREDGVTLPVFDCVVERIDAWPADGWQAYQRRSGTSASAELEKAIARGDEEAQRALARSRFATCAGARAAMRVAEIDFEAGRFASAYGSAQRLYAHHRALRDGAGPPEPVPSRLSAILLAALCERRLLGAHLVGEARAELAKLPAGTPLSLAGTEATAGAFVSSSGDAPAQARASDEPLDRVARGLTAGEAVDAEGPTQVRWQVPLEVAELDVAPSGNGLQGPLSTCFLALAPNVAGKDVLVNDGVRLLCVDAGTGDIRWQFPSAEKVDPPRHRRRNGMTWGDEVALSVAVFGDTAVASLCLKKGEDGLHSRPYMEEPLSLDVVGVDLKTGAPKWSSLDWADPGLHGAGYLANPLLRDDVLYALATRTDDAGAILREVVAVEPAAGRLLWRRALPKPLGVKLGDLERKVGQTARIDEVDGRLFVHANDGLFACIDRADGAVLWQARLQPVAFDESQPAMMWTSFRLQSVSSGPSPSVLCGTTILVVPYGGGRLYALEACTGESKWWLDTPVSYLVGVVAGRAILAGDALIAIDIASRKEVWRADIAAQLSGRPTLAGGQVFVPLYEGIAAFDAAAGPKTDPATPASLPILAAYVATSRWGVPSAGGNIAVLEGRILAVTTTGLTAWTTRRGIEAEAAARIAANPKDADAWILRADLYWATGEMEKACDDYEEAARIIGPAAPEKSKASRGTALDRVYSISRDAAKHAAAATPPDWPKARGHLLRALAAAGEKSRAAETLLALLEPTRALGDRQALLEVVQRLRAEDPWRHVAWGSGPVTRRWDSEESSAPDVESVYLPIWALAEARLRELGVKSSPEALRALDAARAGEGLADLAKVAAGWPESEEAAAARDEVARRVEGAGNSALAAALAGHEAAPTDAPSAIGALRLVRTLSLRTSWAVGEGVLVAEADGHLDAWDLASGDLRWQADAAGTRQLDVIAGRAIASGDRIRAFDLATGAPCWDVEGAAKVIRCEGILFATTERRMRGLEPRTGQGLWEHPIEKENAYPSVSWVEAEPLGDRLLLWASGRVRSLDLLTGMPRYAVEAAQPRPGMNVARAERVLAFVEDPERSGRAPGTVRSRIVGVRRGDGVPVWASEIAPPAAGVRLLTASPSGKGVLTGTDDGRLHVLAVNDGHEVASHALEGREWLPIAATAERLPIAGAEDELLVVACVPRAGSTQVTLAGWDVATGARRWEVPFVDTGGLAAVARDAAVAEDATRFAVAFEQVREGKRTLRVVCVTKGDGAVLLDDDVPFDAPRAAVALTPSGLVVPASDGVRVYEAK